MPYFCLCWHRIIPGILTSVRTARWCQGTWGLRRGDRSHHAFMNLGDKAAMIVVWSIRGSTGLEAERSLTNGVESVETSRFVDIGTVLLIWIATRGLNVCCPSRHCRIKRRGPLKHRPFSNVVGKQLTGMAGC